MTDAANAKTAAALCRLLAESYTLYLKTHNYHWNVTGPMFSTLHTLFETQYTELALAVDEIAERIRALGHRAPGSYGEFRELARIRDAAPETPKAIEMVAHLADDLDVVVDAARAVNEAAEGAADLVSADLATRRIEVSEKNAWMLRSHLE